MIGKKIKVNQYKLTYGKETEYINMYAAFIYKKNGSKYAIYSYENSNILNYGSFFQRGKDAIIMAPKEKTTDLIEEFTNNLLIEKENSKYEIIDLKEIETVQIIEEKTSNIKYDINKLNELTIPKIEVRKEKESTQKKKTILLGPLFFTLFIIVVIAFFFVNPEVIIGKDKYYSCTKKYNHKKLPSEVTEDIILIFSSKGKITQIDVTKDYKFDNIEYYNEFKAKGYFYQYMEEGDSYKFVDNEYKYRIFSHVEINEEYFLPSEEEGLISYYHDKDYTCKRVEKNGQ